MGDKKSSSPDTLPDRPHPSTHRDAASSLSDSPAPPTTASPTSSAAAAATAGTGTAPASPPLSGFPPRMNPNSPLTFSLGLFGGPIDMAMTSSSSPSGSPHRSRSSSSASLSGPTSLSLSLGPACASANTPPPSLSHRRSPNPNFPYSMPASPSSLVVRDVDHAKRQLLAMAGEAKERIGGLERQLAARDADVARLEDEVAALRAESARREEEVARLVERWQSLERRLEQKDEVLVRLMAIAKDRWREVLREVRRKDKVIAELAEMVVRAQAERRSGGGSGGGSVGDGGSEGGDGTGRSSLEEEVRKLLEFALRHGEEVEGVLTREEQKLQEVFEAAGIEGLKWGVDSGIVSSRVDVSGAGSSSGDGGADVVSGEEDKGEEVTSGSRVAHRTEKVAVVSQRGAGVKDVESPQLQVWSVLPTSHDGTISRPLPFAIRKWDIMGAAFHGTELQKHPFSSPKSPGFPPAMALSRRLLAVILAVSAMAVVGAQRVDVSFNQNFAFASWCKPPFCTSAPDGSITLAVSPKSVGVFESKGVYSYGVYSVRMKLPVGYSGGIIPCIYLINPGATSYQSIHDEIDLEFLGGTDPRNITIHTNLITGGQVKLEQFKFPFDPSADFHTYSIVYSPMYVMWMVDDYPIRITVNETGHPFPTLPMEFKASIWDSSSWSWLKANYTNGPIQAQYREFDFSHACQMPQDLSEPPCLRLRSSKHAPWLSKMTLPQIRKERAFKKYYTKMIYDWSEAK
ncbi:unnamed protein product [Closterium sp. Yama58-4]|nr:unnamed protein product [Closterium sp. Yama58-4]